MKANSLRNTLLIGLSLNLFALFGPAFLSTTSCELCAQTQAVTSTTDQSERPTRSVADSVNPNVVIRDTTDADGYRILTFNELAGWDYIYPDSALNYGIRRSADAPLEDRLPGPILALDSQQVSLIGYMMPIRGTREGVTEFILVRNMMICCYGVAPRMNEWMHVKTADGEAFQYHPNVPVRIRGMFRIDERIYRKFVAQLFTMTADDLETDLPMRRPRPGYIYKQSGQ